MNVTKPSQMRKSLGKGGIDDLLPGLATPHAKKPRTSIETPGGRTNSLRASLGATTGAYATPPRPPSALGTPSTAKRATPTSRFETRTNASEVVESLDDHLQPAASTSAPSRRVALASTADPQAYNYRYMFEKIMDRSEVLDTKIDECAELIRQYYSIEDFGDPGAPSQEDLVYVGRIQYETAEGDGVIETDPSKPAPPPTKLTMQTMVLETSRLLGAGSRIPLRFEKSVRMRGADDGQGGVGLFPGMIVAVKGRNAGGSYLGVDELIVLPPLDPPESSPSELLTYQYDAGSEAKPKLGGQPMSIMTACGPFTTDDNLEYAPLDALCDEAKRTRPDVFILMGPFVDDRHPLIKAGDVDDLPTGLFATHVSSRLRAVMHASPSTQVILIPSVRDLISKNAVFPQGPYDRDPELELPKGVKLLPNPAIFSINEVVFAVTSNDTLWHLNNQEVFREAVDAGAAPAPLSNGMPSTSSDGARPSSDLLGAAPAVKRDRMAGMCRHILRQRSFYPLFPSPTGAGVESINLDVTHLELAKLDVGADVVIVPSMLRYFVKVVDSTVVINPSHVTKSANGGTFARLAIHAMPRDELEQGGKMAIDEAGETTVDHRVYERARVDIVRV